MTKYYHEIRDPIHTFIRVTTDERRVVNSPAFQRLRNIHQLAFTYLVYPGATHRRFEHSLGVMELAGRVFDVITNPNYLHRDIKTSTLIPSSDTEIKYWRAVLRMAALCHDIGHLPYSHAAEKELFPDGWNHERMSIEIINSPELKKIWESMTPPLRADDIIKLAVKPRDLKKIRPDIKLNTWEEVLSEIIPSDAFGVDRIDYLLRDSYHSGVQYGNFGHERLIDSLRILPQKHFGSEEPTLGISEGGLNTAEALILARYFMFSQLYCHDVRRIYDIHFHEYAKALFPQKVPIDITKYLELTDNEVSVELNKSARSPGDQKHVCATRIINRKHFKILYKFNNEDRNITESPGKTIYNAACKIYGKDKLRYDYFSDKKNTTDFPVWLDSGEIASSFTQSQILKNIPKMLIDNVYVDPDSCEDARDWLNNNKKKILEETSSNGKKGQGHTDGERKTVGGSG